jgi:hypothetical protein
MDLLLTRYAIERLLYRLSTSSHHDRFVLKGAMLVTTWFDSSVGEAAQRAIWREGDVPIKACSPHNALIPRFELSPFPHSFPRDEGGTGIRIHVGHEPARLPEDHMRAAHGFGWLGRCEASQCDLAHL